MDASVLCAPDTSPLFEHLPVYKTLPERFYRFRWDGYPSPTHHWVFVAQVVDATHSSRKAADHVTMVVDRSGCAPVPVAFYYDKDAPCTFRWSELVAGHTLLVMYAERDSLRLPTGAQREGVRVDALDYAAVLPFSLSVLQGATDGAAPVAAEVREHLDRVVRNVPDWSRFEQDRYHPFPIRGALPVPADFFGKGTCEATE